MKIRQLPPVAVNRIAAGALTPRRAIDVLREGRWITRERVIYCGFLLAIFSAVLLVAGVIVHTRDGLVSVEGGEQLGLDFINYFAGAKAAVRGEAPLVYDRQWFQAFENSLTGPAVPRAYVYPPVALLLSLPLALFSFGWAFAVWVAAGIGSCFELLRRLVGWRAAALAVIGAPAAFFNVYCGQNGYFTAAFLAGGLMALGRRPVIAGICFAFLAYKPQMAVLLPFALAADGRWRTLAAAALAGAALALASFVLFGAATWEAFLGQMPFERHLIEFPVISASRHMTTVFVGLRLFGAPLGLAYAAQLISSALAIAATVKMWRSSASLEIKAATLAVATFLATTIAWDYDEVLLIFAAVWLAREGMRGGFLPWERLAVVALLVLPLPEIAFGVLTRIQLGPIVLWAVLMLLMRRAKLATSLVAPPSHGALQEGAVP